MKLTKEINIDKYRVLADYKVKVAKSPFMSVLQLAKEEGGMLTPEILSKELMYPLSVKACENVLIRLASMGYFKDFVKYEENQWLDEVELFYYELTEFGRHSIETKDFYDKRNGLLEIWVAEGNEFTPKIIKILELPYDEDKEIETKRLNYELGHLINNTESIKLKSGAFTIDKIEKQIKFLKSNRETLTIAFEGYNSTITLVDFLESKQEDKKTAIDAILTNKFGDNYKPKENIILTDLDTQDLSLVRNHKIERPFYKETYFNDITIPNIEVSPKTIEDAREWFERLLKKRVSKYFLSDEEYNEFENKLAIEFQLYKETLVNSISRQQLIEMFGEEDFYKKAKLETIDYLNY